jgi:hypothetical protein
MPQAPVDLTCACEAKKAFTNPAALSQLPAGKGQRPTHVPAEHLTVRFDIRSHPGSCHFECPIVVPIVKTFSHDRPDLKYGAPFKFLTVRSSVP